MKKLFYSVPKFSNKISNHLNKLGCNTVVANKINLGKLIVNNKKKPEKLDKSGVYKISCGDCNSVYIGQTGRNLNQRIKEHRKSIINNVKNSGIASHCVDHNHFIDLDNIKLLHNETKSKRLCLLEQLEIKRSLRKNSEHTTNDQQNFLNTPIIDKLLGKSKMPSQ